ncbi:MAG: CPBP family intramembrane glutamic endopeptidase [Bacteroidota bacterium]|jgi:membrane protease YdiL (CAAX protease family)
MNDDLTSPEVSQSSFRRVFVGKQGIRAGWSIGIFVLLMGMFTAMFIMPTIYLLEKNHLSMKELQPLQTCASDLAAFLGLLAATMVMARIEHEPLIFYGLEGSRRIVRFLYGLFCGVIALSILVGVLNLSGLLIFDGQQMFGKAAITYAIGWGIGFFLVGLYEEYFLRGYLLVTLSRGIGFWWSALVLSILFGCIHITNTGESPVGIVSAVLDGFVCCISLWYLKSLWWAIGFHASWDWAESYLWGTADSGRIAQGHLFAVHPQGNILLSGGATGPEGSLLVIPLLLIIAALMWLAWGRNKNVIDK